MPKEINLAHQTSNDNNVDYKVIKFPDGQQDVVVLPQNHGSKEGFPYPTKSSWRISSRFTSFRDLELILCATAAIKNLETEFAPNDHAGSDISLYLPYLLGARSDRQFVSGGTSYFKDIIAPIINAQGYNSVELLEQHSDVSPALINRSLIRKMKFIGMHAVEQYNLKKVVVIAPDGGALKRAYSATEQLGSVCVDLVSCNKHRDVATGKITHTSISCDDFKQVDVFLVDDICDGGRTFTEIGKLLKARNCGKVFLCIPHGIFSKGLDELKLYFDKIYTTNSFCDITDPFVHQTKVI
jgi:ribose-phosphate pyrophosphokinase